MEFLEKYKELRKSFENAEKLYQEVYTKNELLALAGKGSDKEAMFNSMVELRDSGQKLEYALILLLGDNIVFQFQLKRLIDLLKVDKCPKDLMFYLESNKKSIDDFAQDLNDDQKNILNLAEKIKDLLANRCKITCEFVMEQFK